MKIWSLTFERAQELRRQKSDKAEEVTKLTATSPEAIWLADLDAIDEALDERDVEISAELKREVQAQNKNKVHAAKKVTAAKKKAIKGKKKKDEVRVCGQLCATLFYSSVTNDFFYYT
jgi:DNA topoisomerase-2